jgi:hypothetical protein
MLVYPTDRILSGSSRRPSSEVWILSGLVEKRNPRREPATVATPARAGVDEESVDPVTRRDLDVRIEFTVRLRGARQGLIETCQWPRRSARDVIRLTASSPSIRFGSLRGVGATRVAGASAASAAVVLCRSESAGHGFRARNDERGGFGPFRRQRRRGFVRESRSFL